MYQFKSEAHRAMFLRMVALQLRCNLLRRFGGTRQEECRIIRSQSARRLLYQWASDIVDRLPAAPVSQSEFIAKESVRLPEKVLRDPSIEVCVCLISHFMLFQPLIQHDAGLRWLVDRLKEDQALVPKPYFPSVLRYRLPQFPFHPYEIDKARHLYGLLKFPFYSLTADIHAAPSESFQGLKEPVMPNEVTVNGKHTIASDCIYHDGGSMGSVDYIYLPSELETGLGDKAM